MISGKVFLFSKENNVTSQIHVEDFLSKEKSEIPGNLKKKINRKSFIS